MNREILTVWGSPVRLGTGIVLAKLGHQKRLLSLIWVESERFLSGRVFSDPMTPVQEGRGQALVEYLLMTLMLLFIFTTLYRVLQGQLRMTFQQVGRAILFAYY